MAHRIAVVGGTGAQGKGLAYRFARQGHTVVLGSRSAERAAEAAAEIVARVPGADITGTGNAEALEGVDLVLLAVPYAGHDELVAELAGGLADRIVVSCVNPLGFDKRGPFGLEVPGGSSAETLAALVPDARVVGSFHHVSAVSLWGPAEVLDHEDILVCGDDAEAKAVVVDLCATVTGRPGIDAGALRLARQLEPWTAVLISINKRYKTQSGVLIAGVGDH